MKKEGNTLEGNPQKGNRKIVPILILQLLLIFVLISLSFLLYIDMYALDSHTISIILYIGIPAFVVLLLGGAVALSDKEGESRKTLKILFKFSIIALICWGVSLKVIFIILDFLKGMAPFR